MAKYAWFCIKLYALIRSGDNVHQNVAKLANSFIKKLASNVETITVDAHDPLLMKYKDQIFKIIQKRYGQELGMQIIPFLGALKFIPDELFHKLLGKISQVVITIDRDTDTVLAISGIKQGHNNNRVQMFALKPMEGMKLSQVKAAKQAVDQQIERLFSGKNYMEFSLDLFEKAQKMYALYKKNHPDGVSMYIYPAWVAARVLPRRRIHITDNGVIYEKKVHRAGATAKKILIGSVPVLAGVTGYPTIEEASQNAKYVGKMLRGRYGGEITVTEFNPDLWDK